MGKGKRIAGLLSLALATMPVFAAAPAGADCAGMREFRGRIVKLESSGRKAGFTIENRSDDRVRFKKPKTVEFVDTRSADARGRAGPVARWGDLETGLYVSVCWKFTDSPSLAHKVIVHR